MEKQGDRVNRKWKKGVMKNEKQREVIERSRDGGIDDGKNVDEGKYTD